jgi:hypothetical protein
VVDGGERFDFLGTAPELNAILQQPPAVIEEDDDEYAD